MYGYGVYTVYSCTVLGHLQKYVQMSALDDKDVPSAEQWQSACNFMSASLKKYIKQAEDDLRALVGPTAFYDRWIKWKSQSHIQVSVRIF